MLRVTNPFDEVFNVIAAATRVKDTFYFVFDVVINGYRKGRGNRVRAVGVRGRAHIWTEDRDVEDGVDAQGIWKDEAVGDRGNHMGYGVWANEPGLKFLGGAGCLGSKVNVCGRQQNLISHMELYITTRLVGIAFLIGLGQGESIGDRSDVVVQCLEKFSGSWDGVRDGSESGIGIVGVLAKVDLERTHPSGSIGGVVAGKFRGGELEVPIVLPVTSESTEHVLKSAVRSFGLAVGLGVECG
jgi:hypothetical protein